MPDTEIDQLRAALREKLGADADQYGGSLEDAFPHIARQVVELWGTARLDAYLHDLMLPHRDGRRGFPPEVASDLMRLAALHGRLGLTKEPSGSVWQWAADADLVRGGKH